MVQATETVKLILGSGDSADRSALALRRARDDVPGDEGPQESPVPDLRHGPSIRKLIDYQEFCGVPGRSSAPAGSGARTPEEITPQELQALSSGSERPLILDVRNPEEIAICRIAGSTVIPLPELSNRLHELDRSRAIVVHCKSGVRSAKAIALLEAAGFTGLQNLQGGILAWIKEVDPSLPVY